MTPEAIEAVLADFRAWLSASQAEAASPADEPAPIDLHTLLGQFAALRHEVNLQTKASRAQQEQSGAVLEQLNRAMELVRTSQSERASDDSQAQIELVRPLLKALVDVYDALALAAREVQRAKDTFIATLDQLATPTSQSLAPAKSLWAKWFGSRQPEHDHAHQAEERERQQQAMAQVRQVFESLLTGYRMSLQRIERVLQEQGLDPIGSPGEPFDPEQMEAVAVVSDSNRPSGEVVEVVRPGYRWRGRVFRYAQVSVAKA